METMNWQSITTFFTCFRTTDLACTIGENAHCGFLRSFVLHNNLQSQGAGARLAL